MEKKQGIEKAVEKEEAPPDENAEMKGKKFDMSDQDLEETIQNERRKEERRKIERRKHNRRKSDRDKHELLQQECAGHEEEIGKLKDEIESLKDNLLRRQADFENFKKRVAKQQGEYKKLAIKDLALEVILINDDLLRALEASESLSESGDLEEAHRSFVDGVSMISRRLEETLANFGVKEVDALNQAFNPTFHEAVEIEEIEDVEDDTVTRVYLKGFRMDELVVRSARVRVAKPLKKEEGDKDTSVEDKD
jgi:molecular chaperone GrpE